MTTPMGPCVSSSSSVDRRAGPPRRLRLPWSRPHAYWPLAAARATAGPTSLRPMHPIAAPVWMPWNEGVGLRYRTRGGQPPDDFGESEDGRVGLGEPGVWREFEPAFAAAKFVSTGL